MNPLLNSTRCPQCGTQVALPGASSAMPFGSVKSASDELVNATLAEGEKRKPRYLLLALAILGPMFVLGTVVTVYYSVFNSEISEDPRHEEFAQQEESGQGLSAISKVVSFADQQTYKIPKTEIAYALNPSDKFSYKFEGRTEIGKQVSTLVGNIDFTVTDRDPYGYMTEDDLEEGEGTGSAFVVHPDGYLVTCAHVVEGSTKVEVQLGGKSYEAKVVDLVHKHDLALIRIDAQGLTPIPIMDSDTVELAEEVRVVGYPLSDILGESLKISRGTIAGINASDKEVASSTGIKNDRFQLDAAVNPGNSGGPVVTEKGHLAGVASALLSGEGLTNVGFAVPANHVRRIASGQKLNFVQADVNDPYLRGPELAKKIEPSMALVTVTKGPKGVGMAPQHVLSYKATMQRLTNRGQGSVTMYKNGSPTQESGTTIVDIFGDVSYCSGDVYLPAYLDLVGAVGLEKLPEETTNEWTEVKLRLIPQKQETNVLIQPELPPGLSRNPYLRLRTLQPTQIKKLETRAMHPAIELSKYKIVKRKLDTVEIEKTHETFTVHEDDIEPFYHLTGTSRIVFDKKQGRLMSIEFKGTIDITVDKETVPIAMTYACTAQQPTGSTSKPSAGSPGSRSTASNTPAPKPTPSQPPKPTPPRPVKEIPKSQGLSKLRLD